MENFSGMMESVMSASVTVLDRQNKNYFGLDLSERLAEETRSARYHNMVVLGSAEDISACYHLLYVMQNEGRQELVNSYTKWKN